MVWTAHSTWWWCRLTRRGQLAYSRRRLLLNVSELVPLMMKRVPQHQTTNKLFSDISRRDHFQGPTYPSCTGGTGARRGRGRYSRERGEFFSLHGMHATNEREQTTRGIDGCDDCVEVYYYVRAERLTEISRRTTLLLIFPKTDSISEFYHYC